MRTAYFLGAGASYSLLPNFPLSRDLTIERLLDRRNYAQESYMAIESQERGPDVITELREAVASGRLPAEILGARLEDVLDRLPPAEGVPGLRERVLYLVMKRLTLTVDGSLGALSSLLWNAQRAGDLFLTTNYDTLLEWELGLMGAGFQWSPLDAVGPDARYWLDWGVPASLEPPLDGRDARAKQILGAAWASLPILKLHGSVSWSGCPTCNLYDLDPLFKDGATDSIGGWLACKRCQRLRQPVFVPPVHRKDVASHPVIRAIWDRAQGELRRTNRIVFAGFSLDPSDTAVRSLLEETNGPNLQAVVVVDPAAEGEIGDRFRALYGSKVSLRSESWAAFLESHRPIHTA